MKKIMLILTLFISLLILYFCLLRAPCFFRPLDICATFKKTIPTKPELLLDNAIKMLKLRKDAQAEIIFSDILSNHPDNLDALWGKAEILRRKREYAQAEPILAKILSRHPQHSPSLISLCYIKIQAGDLKGAQILAKKVLDFCNDSESVALGYMLLGNINSRWAAQCWLIGKIKYGTQIRCYLLKAKELAPDLPEVRLGLGSFYLLAPSLIGGNLDKALEELQVAVKLAPDFATANARLAQAYKKKGNLAKSDFYWQRVKELDPENEVLKEYEKSGD